MDTMKAYARIDADSMRVEILTLPIPAIAEDEVLVSIEAFGVGVHDRYFIPDPKFSSVANAKFPYVIGIEGAGRITEVGARVADRKIGDRVVFTSSMNPKGGTWAEYAAVKEAALMAIPDDLSFDVAATIPVAGGTAFQGLMNLDLQSGETLFIAGASGAIGTIAIQLATKMGVRVSGSASAANLKYMKSLGVEKAVDYTDPDWQEQIKEWSGGGVDAALAIQPDTEATAVKVARDGGRVIAISGYGKDFPQERGIKVAQIEHETSTREDLERLLGSIADGSIKQVIEAKYPFAEALKALEKTETRHGRGKLVVKVKK